MTLLLVLALLQGAAPSYDLAVPAPRRTLQVSGISPASPTYGEPVTVTGTGLDQVRAVIVGDYAPVILKQDATTLVFRAPRVRGRSQYETRVFLVSPGLPIASVSGQVIFSQRQRQHAKAPQEAGLLFDEEVKLKPHGSKRYELDGKDAASFSLQLEVSDGEVEASLEPLEPKGEPRVRATYGGALQWQVTRRELSPKGPMPARLALTLSSGEDKELTVKVKVVRGQAKS